MELFINETPVGVTIEANDTVQSLLRSIEKELDPSLMIMCLVIDGHYYTLDDAEILGKALQDIHKIELTIATQIEIGLSLLEDGKRFLSIAAEEFKIGSIAKKSEIIATILWIKESLDALRMSLAFPPSDISVLKTTLEDVLKYLDQERLSLEQITHLGSVLEKMISHFTTLQEKLQEPTLYNEESTITKLTEAKNILPELAIKFQTGQDVEALNMLSIIIDSIEMYSRFAATQIENSTTDEHAAALKDISNQMLEAFENKDFILIADLLEYDLLEQIESILESSQA